MSTIPVNCKINLGLNIVRKRPDGYHDLETVFYPTDYYTDKLTLEESDSDFEFVCESVLDVGPDDKNLCVKAFRLLQRDFGIRGARLRLEKHIPTGAGLGGGSADAAFTLKMVADYFNLPLGNAALLSYAAQLGSDVPFFLLNTPAYATGRGEILQPIPLDLSDYEIRIEKPDVSVSTREAYAGVTPKLPAVHVCDIIRTPVTQWRDLLHNDFEDSIFEQHPELAEIKRSFYENGATYASMSGSGTAVYGLFRK
jgi:4-diphosphocytidyl-2-C-methyl-D-erythritol kinase